MLRQGWGPTVYTALGNYASTTVTVPQSGTWSITRSERQTPPGKGSIICTLHGAKGELELHSNNLRYKDDIDNLHDLVYLCILYKAIFRLLWNTKIHCVFIYISTSICLIYPSKRNCMITYTKVQNPRPEPLLPLKYADTFRKWHMVIAHCSYWGIWNWTFSLNNLHISLIWSSHSHALDTINTIDNMPHEYHALNTMDTMPWIPWIQLIPYY